MKDESKQPTVDAQDLRSAFVIEPSMPDPKMVFYQMGYEAALVEHESSRKVSEIERPRWGVIGMGIAASVLAFLLGTSMQRTMIQKSASDPIAGPDPQAVAADIPGESNVIGSNSDSPSPSTLLAEQDIESIGMLTSLDFVSNAMTEKGFTLTATGVRMRSPLVSGGSVDKPRLSTLRPDEFEFEI
ncbi:MAG: hypothetical protein AAGJ83_08980 [Planctomycetota bacterium]